ncbi:MAG: ABC transporter ATP-binding protein, partial [Alphaproteobacteria bacterium HGW-Alphaproteobacteria-10]
ALAVKPRLIVCDEAVSALDVSVQAQILELIRDLRSEFNMGVLLITHDMGVIAEMADRVVVMYAGQVVEQSSAQELFENPQHPYTRLLLRSIPSASSKQTVLPLIEGTTPTPSELPEGCRFHPRCPIAVAACKASAPVLLDCGNDHLARCFRLEDAASLLGATKEVAT